MATKQENALAIKARIEHRAEVSKSILESAGYSSERFAAVVMNAMVVNPSLAECTVAIS